MSSTLMAAGKETALAKKEGIEGRLSSTLMAAGKETTLAKKEGIEERLSAAGREGAILSPRLVSDGVRAPLSPGKLVVTTAESTERLASSFGSGAVGTSDGSSDRRRWSPSGGVFSGGSSTIRTSGPSAARASAAGAGGEPFSSGDPA